VASSERRDKILDVLSPFIRADIHYLRILARPFTSFNVANDILSLVHRIEILEEGANV